jgi:predicted secreted protein
VSYPNQPPPAGGYGAPPAGGQPPANNLVWGILTTLFCCLPLGVASIVFAAQVNGKWAAGDYAGAQESADKARKFAMWAAIAGIIVIVLYVILIVIVGVGASTTDS